MSPQPAAVHQREDGRAHAEHGTAPEQEAMFECPQPRRGRPGAPQRREGQGELCIVDILRGHIHTLAAAGIASPQADAFTLARHALGMSPATLRTAVAAAVPRDRLDQLDELVAIRALRVPLQHITGEVGFRRLTLSCRPGVFIPRPETEVVAEAAIERARAAVAKHGRATVVEPCTGSGAIALSVAHEVARARVIAIDLDRAAVALARENLARVTATCGLAPAASCDVRAGDLLTPVPLALRGRVDVVVANAPYLTPAELAACAPEVRNHDPHLALVGGGDGHAITERLLAAAPEWLRAGGVLLLEVAETRAAAVAARADRLGYDDIAIVADLAGRPRLVVASAVG